MHIPATLRTSFGPRQMTVAPMIKVHLTAREVHIIALSLEREAEAAEKEGRHDVSSTLSWRAAALRETAR